MPYAERVKKAERRDVSGRARELTPSFGTSDEGLASAIPFGLRFDSLVGLIRKLGDSTTATGE